MEQRANSSATTSAAEVEDEAALRLNRLVPCNCDSCHRNMHAVAMKLCEWCGHTDVSAEPLIAGALLGALDLVIANQGNHARSREQMRLTYLRLAAETFDRFATEEIEHIREFARNHVPAGMH